MWREMPSMCKKAEIPASSADMIKMRQANYAAG